MGLWGRRSQALLLMPVLWLGEEALRTTAKAGVHLEDTTAPLSPLPMLALEPSATRPARPADGDDHGAMVDAEGSLLLDGLLLPPGRVCMGQAQTPLGLSVVRHLVLVLAALLGEGTGSVVDPLVTVDLLTAGAASAAAAVVLDGADRSGAFEATATRVGLQAGRAGISRLAEAPEERTQLVLGELGPASQPPFTGGHVTVQGVVCLGYSDQYPGDGGGRHRQESMWWTVILREPGLLLLLLLRRALTDSAQGNPSIKCCRVSCRCGPLLARGQAAAEQCATLWLRLRF